MYTYIRRNIIMATTAKDTKKVAVETTEVKETAKKAPAKKAEAKKETVKKETVKKETTKKAATKTAEKKEVAKKAPAKKETAKKTTTKKADAAKKETTKASTKKATMKVNMHVQFEFKDYNAETIYELAINDYVAAGNKKTSIKNLVAYVKAEDNKVYYVINDEYKGEVWL